ncbi:hypothetical protein Gpo141_00011811 [Globisporangium polare]
MEDSSANAPLPPPLPVTTPSAAVRSGVLMNSRARASSNSSSSSSSGGGGNASMGDVLLRKRWAIHWMSRMYHFRRDELSVYAHDLVKSLRDEALLAFKREFGYKVSIRHTDAFVAFEVLEERDAGDVNMEPLKQLPGLQQADVAVGSRVRAQMTEPLGSARSNASGFGLTGGASRRAESTAKRDGESKDAGDSARQRRGGFVLYFPVEDEDEQMQPRMSMSQRKMKETQYVVLLRGSEDLLGWACAWLQTRFQCIVSEQRVSISPVNLKWFARNWVVDSLMKEGKKSLPSRDQESEKTKQPLLLKYRNQDEQSMVRQYTLTVPWATLRRLCEQAKQAADASDAIPELIQMTEDLYFETLPLNMAAFELEGLEMTEVSVSHSGRIEFYNMALVHSALQGLAELLCIQNVPGPAKPVMTL